MIFHGDRVDILSLTTSNFKHNVMKIRRYKCRYLFYSHQLFEPPLKEQELGVVMSLITTEGFLKGKLPHSDRVDSNVRDTCKMVNIIMKIEHK